MIIHTLYYQQKHFCCYCLQVFRKSEIIKCHINDIVLKLTVNKGSRCLKKVNFLDSKTWEIK